MRALVRILLAATGVAVPVCAAHAQAVDYAALGETFGEPVTTSVTGKPQRASDAPASLTIITRDQIARSPARTVPDLLKAYAGVDVNRWTAGQSDVAVRGGVQTYNARLLVLVNGHQVYLDHYGMTDWNLLGVQLDEIQQIELVRGPASALFGFNAASGVVNIITVDPLTARSLSATGEIGNHGYSRISAAAAIPLGEQIGIRISGGHQRENERAIPGDLYRPQSILDTTADQAGATLTARPGAATTVEVNGAWSANRQLEFLPSQILTEQRFHSQTVGLKVDHDTGWGSLDGHVYRNWLRADYGVTTSPSDPFGDVASLDMRNRILVAQGSALVRLGDDNMLRIGAEYRDNQLVSDRLFSRRIGYQVAAASGMVDLHPGERVAVTLAARLDHLWLGQSGSPVQPQVDPVSAWNRSITPVSFNAALTVAAGRNGQFRLNGGRGIQSPSLTDFGLRLQIPVPGSPVPVFLTGDPAMRPVIVWSGEVGYAQRFGSGLRLDGSLFFTRTDGAIASPGDPIDYRLITSPIVAAITRFANVGWYETYGAELSAAGRLLPGLDWQANYSWTRVREDLPADRTPYIFALFPRATTPRHLANVQLHYQTGRWFADALAHYRSATAQFAFLPDTTLQLEPVARAVTLDAKLGVHLSRGLTAYVAGENLGQASGAYGSPIPADRRLRVGLSVAL